MDVYSRCVEERCPQRTLAERAQIAFEVAIARRAPDNGCVQSLLLKAVPATLRLQARAKFYVWWQ
jgi:hypothetical protein